MAELIEGNYYHIFNRGHNKFPIYFEDRNYFYFLKQFQKYIIPYADVFAYCLMPNHFHVFLRVNSSEHFQKGIRNFLISYSKSINELYGRIGSLFQGRYKSSNISTDDYFTRIIVYIHQNPIRAGLVEKLEDYNYSSYRSILYEDSSFVSAKEVIDWFGGVNQYIDAHALTNDV